MSSSLETPGWWTGLFVPTDSTIGKCSHCKSESVAVVMDESSYFCSQECHSAYEPTDFCEMSMMKISGGTLLKAGTYTVTPGAFDDGLTDICQRAAAYLKRQVFYAKVGSVYAIIWVEPGNTQIGVLKPRDKHGHYLLAAEPINFMGIQMKLERCATVEQLYEKVIK